MSIIDHNHEICNLIKIVIVEMLHSNSLLNQSPPLQELLVHAFQNIKRTFYVYDRTKLTFIDYIELLKNLETPLHIF